MVDGHRNALAVDMVMVGHLIPGGGSRSDNMDDRVGDGVTENGAR